MAMSKKVKRKDGIGIAIIVFAIFVILAPFWSQLFWEPYAWLTPLIVGIGIIYIFLGIAVLRLQTK